MDWKINSNNKLEKEFIFNNFSEAINFVNKVADLAEKQNHHPDILLFAYKKVRLSLFTHDEDKVTDKDKSLASLIDNLN